MSQFAPLLRKDSQPVRYLVVDDSVFARKNLIKMIELFGGEVAGEAGDGLTAIAEFNRSKPDIVLMDITMPQMEGIESVERIVRQHPDARIVMVSSVGYQENILAALQKGGLDAQVKSWLGPGANLPVTAEQLRAVLGNAQVQEFARQLGLPVDQALKTMAQYLPEIVDKASPNGVLKS